ncbi:MAG: diguanylate cyclase, partial [Desulfosalsimonadaceae bacterium]
NWDSIAENPVSLLVVDIDYFKRINEQYGSGVGDQALVHVAGILKQVSGKTGILFGQCIEPTGSGILSPPRGDGNRTFLGIRPEINHGHDRKNRHDFKILHIISARVLPA